jgi:hypothetical protein
MPLHEKRWITERLISITQRTFHLLPEQGENITIQFLPRYKSPDVNDQAEAMSAPPPKVVLEVSSEALPAEALSAFVEAAAPMLSHSAAVGSRGQLSRMLRIGANQSRQIAFTFNQLDSQNRQEPAERKAA